jgi:hypothetical protein
MNKTHLHIIGSKSFSDLLGELNFNYSISSDKNVQYSSNNFLVRIIFVEKLQLAEIKILFLENIPTIFFLNNKDFLIKNKLTLLDFHV